MPSFAQLFCAVWGHHVVEYACFCGHTFLRAEGNLTVVRHPAICVVAGHWIIFVTKRAGYSEYICRNCGHPFCFADPVANRSRPHRRDTPAHLARPKAARTMMT